MKERPNKVYKSQLPSFFLLVLFSSTTYSTCNQSIDDLNNTINAVAGRLSTTTSNVDKARKSAAKAINAADSVFADINKYADPAHMSKADFEKNVTVIKGTNNDAQHHGDVMTAPDKDAVKPTFEHGKFTNIDWKPIAYFDGNLFPSSIISMAKYGEPPTGKLEEICRPLGFRVVGTTSNTYFNWEIECEGNTFFNKAQGTAKFEKAGQETDLMPEIAWKIEKLSKQVSPTPITVTFRIMDDNGHKEEKVSRLNIRSINDCIYKFADMDMDYEFTAFIQEDHPEISGILKEALDKRYVDAFTGYQGDENETHMQVAAIWRVLHDRKIRYSNGTQTGGYSESVHSQAVRTFDNAMKTNQANCVDGTVVFASILRRIHISTVLVVTPEHCFLGYYTDKTKKKVAYLETTMLSNSDYVEKARTKEEKRSAYMKQFKDALEEGKSEYADYKTKNDVTEINVDDMRKLIQPLPFY